jgi:hypothetical protein
MTKKQAVANMLKLKPSGGDKGWLFNGVCLYHGNSRMAEISCHDKTIRCLPSIAPLVRASADKAYTIKEENVII